MSLKIFLRGFAPHTGVFSDSGGSWVELLGFYITIRDVKMHIVPPPNRSSDRDVNQAQCVQAFLDIGEFTEAACHIWRAATQLVIVCLNCWHMCY